MAFQAGRFALVQELAMKDKELRHTVRFARSLTDQAIVTHILGACLRTVRAAIQTATAMLNEHLKA